ncbi:MAG TPA: T9SS type A sorting domain-containing protein, partial [Chitinophagales bacterium]|nr:T9SS type A sorting domain-containing protein [Chitinophagales bacterium]
IKYYTKLSARDNLNIQISKETARKEQLLQELLHKFADTKDYVQLDELLTVENTTYTLRALLWSKIERGDYGAAQSLLTYLPAETPDEQDYKKVQTIYWQFRTATNGFVLTDAQYTSLRTIADADNQQSARACALLALLRGEYCDWVLPEDAGKTAAAAAPHYRTVPLLSRSVLNRLRVLPNPAGVSFEVELPVYFAEQRGSSVQVLDMSGRVVQQVAIDKEQQKVVVLSENLANGLYVVQYFADGIVVSSAKVVVQH